jgi:hypothetical protein
MSWLFSQALVEEYSEANSLDGTPFVPSNTTPTPQAFLSRDKTTDAWNRFPSGMTCEPLTESRGEELLKSFLVASHAPTSVPPARAQESKANSQDCGEKWRALSAKFDRDSSSWKTAHCLLSEVLPWSLVTLPNWGMMRAGELWEPMTRVLPTIEKDFGWWATPSARDWKDTAGMSRKREGNRHRIDQLPRQVYASEDGSGSFIPPTATKTETALCVNTIMRIAGVPAQAWTSANTPSKTANYTPDQGCGLLNPTWTEWLMGWPLAWTDLKPLATDKFQQWLRSHGVFLVAQAMTEEAA